MACSGSAACGTAPAPVCMRGGRRHGLLHCVVAAGRSALPRTTSGGPHSPGARSLAVSWRGLPKSLGEAAGRGDAHLEGAGAPVDARTRPPSPAARGPRAWAEGARRDHHHRGARRDVGHRHDGHRDGRRGGGLRLRGRRSLRDRMHRAPCRQAREPLRGPGADPPGHPRTLRGHRRRRGPWAAAASRPRVELLGRRFFNRRSRSSASKAPRASCGSPKATASRSASSAR